MPEPSKNLGKLISSHGTSAAYLQRAAIIAAVSFVFFLAMLAAFYVRQHVGYFALSTAFLILYLLTLIGWVLQRRNIVSIYENGIKYKKFAASWDEVETASVVGDAKDRTYIQLRKSKRDSIVIPSSILGFDQIVRVVRTNVKDAV